MSNEQQLSWLDFLRQQSQQPEPAGLDMADIRGQQHVKRAFEVAAAGGHSLLLVGSHGVGKATLGRAFSTLAPDVPFHIPDPRTFVLPDEGIVLMEDLHCYDQQALTALREATRKHAPLLVVATLTTCLCGYYLDPTRDCRCTSSAIDHYYRRLRSALRTCFPIQVEVPRVERDVFLDRRLQESSRQVCRRIEAAHNRQRERYGCPRLNADLRSFTEVQEYCKLDTDAEKLLKVACQSSLCLEMYQVMRLHTIARTIADLVGASTIAAHHVAEAIMHLKDRR